MGDRKTIVMTGKPLPGIIAIMPFENETENQEIAEQVRRTFYNHFSSKPFKDIELMVVDEKIAQLEKSSGKKIFQIPPKEVCRAMGCNGLIYGRVKGYARIFAAIYSQLSVEAEVWMIDAGDDREVFRVVDSVRYHGGTIPTSLYGLVFSPIAAAINLRDIQRIRILNELCHKLNQRIPSPQRVLVENNTVLESLPELPPYDTITVETMKKKAVELSVEAGSFFGKGNYGKASYLYEESLKAFPSAGAYYYLAICCQQMGEDEKAMQLLLDGAEKFPEEAVLWRSLGMVHYQKGNIEEARSAFSKALRLNPEENQAAFLYDFVGK